MSRELAPGAAYAVLHTPSGPVRFRVNVEARDDEPVLVRENNVTPDELREHMRKVRSGEIRPMPESERTEYLFRRWRGVLERLADGPECGADCECRTVAGAASGSISVGTPDTEDDVLCFVSVDARAKR